MKVLLIDNGTHYKKRLADLLTGHEVVRVPFDKLDNSLHQQGFGLIVLSGAYNTHSVKYYGDTLYATEQKFVRQSKVPVIGICFGAQIIAHMYGATLSWVPGGKRLKGLKLVYNVIKTPFGFFPYYGARVWSVQRWRITELPPVLSCWCASNEGVEVFRHINKPFYGLQFHPERRTGDNDGARIFNSIIEFEQNVIADGVAKEEAHRRMTRKPSG